LLKANPQLRGNVSPNPPGTAGQRPTAPMGGRFASGVFIQSAFFRNKYLKIVVQF